MKLKSEGAGRGRALALALLLVSILGAGGALLALGASDPGRRPDVREPDRLTLAKAAFADRDYARAETLLREMLKALPDHRGARVFLGRVLVERGRLLEARDLLSGVLKDDPKDYEATRAMAAALRGLGQRDLAAASLQRAAQLDGGRTDPGLYKELGILERERGDALAALTALQQSLSLDPNQEDLRTVLAELGTGKDGLAEGRSRSPLPGGLNPMNPRPVDPADAAPGPRVPDPAQLLPRAAKRNR